METNATKEWQAQSIQASWERHNTTRAEAFRAHSPDSDGVLKAAAQHRDAAIQAAMDGNEQAAETPSSRYDGDYWYWEYQKSEAKLRVLEARVRTLETKHS